MSQNKSKQLIGIILIIIIAIGSYMFWQKLSDELSAGSNINKFISKESITPDWLKKRIENQLNETDSWNVFHQFSFEDRIAESRIEFEHLINPDCGKDYKPVHYDHGNGIAVADIDNDGLLDIYFVSQVGPGELWRNLGNGQFEDITEGSGLKATGEKSCISASFADVDNDGDADLYVSTIRKGNFLFSNDGNGQFIDISEEAGVNYHGHSAGVTFFDYNLDGLLDIFLANVGIYTTDEVADFSINGNTYNYFVGFKDGFAGHLKEERFEKSSLYKNLGNNTFENVSQQAGIQDVGWTGDAIILDGNDDGYPDLYVTNMQGNDLFYENQQGNGFVEKRMEYFPKTPWGSMGICSFDYDNNGRQDLYITDMHSDMIGGDIDGEYFDKEKLKAEPLTPESYLLTEGMSLFGNGFYSQTSEQEFVEISDQINAENYWPWGVSNGDLNADGYEDLFVCASMNYPYRYAPNLVLLNESGSTFRSSEFVLNIEPRKEFSKPWFTLDCSGKDADHLLCADQDEEIEIWGAKGSRSSVIFDLDNDGDLDIVTNEFNDPPQVLISNLSDQMADMTFLKIGLEGSVSNRDGIGAKVIVEAGDQTYTKVKTGKSGYLSQSAFPLYFGLNSIKKVDKIRVIWPSGIQQELINPNVINDLLVIKEPMS